jgi:hypothetical protein
MSGIKTEGLSLNEIKKRKDSNPNLCYEIYDKVTLNRYYFGQYTSTNEFVQYGKQLGLFNITNGLRYNFNIVDCLDEDDNSFQPRGKGGKKTRRRKTKTKGRKTKGRKTRRKGTRRK